jgi:hypothetical protein
VSGTVRGCPRPRRDSCQTVRRLLWHPGRVAVTVAVKPSALSGMPRPSSPRSWEPAESRSWIKYSSIGSFHARNWANRCRRSKDAAHARGEVCAEIWDNQCDRCGARETLLTPTMLPLGHMTVFDHVCDAVPMKIKIMRFKRAERVLLVERQPRRQPKRIPRSKRKM